MGGSYGRQQRCVYVGGGPFTRTSPRKGVYVCVCVYACMCVWGGHEKESEEGAEGAVGQAPDRHRHADPAPPRRYQRQEPDRHLKRRERKRPMSKPRLFIFILFF